MRKLLILFLFFSVFHSKAQDFEMLLWEDTIPGSIENNEYQEAQKFDGDHLIGVSKVKEPKLYAYMAKGDSLRSAVIIFPGGGYSHLAIDKEGFKLAEWLVSKGISAFVLKYRLPDDHIMENKSVVPLMDAQRAVRLLRGNAEKWNLDPDKIGIMGFSAGGHLAASLSTHFNEKVYPEAIKESARPDFSILVYPVVSLTNEITHLGSRERLLGKTPSEELVEYFSNETQVSENTPPTFLVHAMDDHAVPVENSLKYLKALKENKVPTEIHIFENGGHGFGMGRQLTNNTWTTSLLNWLKLHHYKI
ncbi:alpha/beta hydrolase [Zunongwangia pacifica]|uniref:Alpha/beta hydrolase n=1 Tax=Zunongwangia pacifica TaxID=2911062 RepID=A0A9X2CP08_9FLAO|nr:alpha/beta hydrolase [Zunongwangia pacifica]MCL6217533.1 alpha/beta hydrolase [Zunongwangia pacifica]